METPENKLKTKLVQLQMTVSRTGKVLNTESSQAIERQQASLKTTTTEIEILTIRDRKRRSRSEENYGQRES